MPKRLPSKLPQVEGDDPVAEGFRIAFERINQLIDYCESLTPRPGLGTKMTHSQTGYTRQAEDTGGGRGDEGKEARWA